MSKNIWQPLGMKDTTFFPRKRPDLLDRMVGTTIRDPTGSGKVVPYPGKPFFDSFKDCHGGAGLVSSMPDNLKVLQSLLTDDEKLLKKETVAQMFEPQLSKESADALNGLRGDANGMKLFIGTFPPEPRYDWGIGGILTMDDIKGWRNKGTMIWGGMPNLFWVSGSVFAVVGCRVIAKRSIRVSILRQGCASFTGARSHRQAMVRRGS